MTGTRLVLAGLGLLAALAVIIAVMLHEPSLSPDQCSLPVNQRTGGWVCPQ